MENSIGWCNLTFNPVWGCRNKCPYCYARAIAKRFKRKIAKLEYKNYICDVGEDAYDVMRWIDELAERLKFFMPTFLHSQFNKKFPKKPQRIFVGSMSEIYYWKKEWIRDVLDKILEYPQHTFMFLTRHPEVYSDWYFHSNCWLGVTVTKNEHIHFIEKNQSKVRFLSIEPILEKIDIGNIDDFEPDWIIVGAETGNRKGKVVPNGSWVFDIIDFCNRTGVPLYIKDNLSKYYGEFRGYQQFPTIKKL